MKERITKTDIQNYKKEFLDGSVLISPDVAAEVLSVSERTVHTLVKDGELHGYARRRGARGLRILASELRDYINSIKIDHDTWRE